jgi:hypothetical protein
MKNAHVHANLWIVVDSGQDKLLQDRAYLFEAGLCLLLACLGLSDPRTDLLNALEVVAIILLLCSAVFCGIKGMTLRRHRIVLQSYLGKKLEDVSSSREVAEVLNQLSRDKEGALMYMESQMGYILLEALTSKELKMCQDNIDMACRKHKECVEAAKAWAVNPGSLFSVATHVQTHEGWELDNTRK